MVQGPHDDCLKWPAAGTISIVLLDRKHNNHKLWCCLGRNFLRPPKDVVAAGCYDFLNLMDILKMILCCGNFILTNHRTIYNVVEL